MTRCDPSLTTQLSASPNGTEGDEYSSPRKSGPVAPGRPFCLPKGNGSGHASAVNSGRDPNPYGHIARFRESQSRDTAFFWDVFLLAGDPAYDATVPSDQTLFGSPDGIWIDPDGRVWIRTDVSNSSRNLASRGYDSIGNNALLAADPDTGEVRRFSYRAARLRDHGHHHHSRPANDVRQRSAPRRIDPLLERSPGHTEPREPEHREHLALRWTSAPGHGWRLADWTPARSGPDRGPKRRPGRGLATSRFDFQSPSPGCTFPQMLAPCGGTLPWSSRHTEVTNSSPNRHSRAPSYGCVRT